MARAEPIDARVLIVDDHPVFRFGLAQMLSAQSGLAVCGEAESAEEALPLVTELQPDLLVVDLSLPGVHGLELVKRAREASPGILVLVCSMYDEALFAERALRAGARGYVEKQEPVAEIVTAVREVLAGRRYVSPRIARRLDQPEREGRGSDDPIPSRLSDRELEVFTLIGRGLGTREIAERLGLSVKTVETYREHLKEKLALGSGAELTRRAVAWVLAQE